MKLNIYKLEIKFTSHKRYLFRRLCSIKAKKTHPDQNTLQVLLLCSNQNDSQSFKSSSCSVYVCVICIHVFLQCVCCRCNLLQWMFFIPCDYWKTFFTKVCRYFEIFSTAILLLYLKQVFWKKPYFTLFLQCSALMPMLQK